MTPEERFDALWSSYLGQTFSLEDEAKDWLKRAFCAQIREAVKEALRFTDYGHLVHELERKARTSAFADAAKIVADAPGNTYDRDCDHAQLAASIRARAAEVGK